MTVDASDWTRFPVKTRAALAVLAELCGGEDYCKVVSEGNAAIVVHAFSSDASDPFDVEISFDGSVSRAADSDQK